MSSEQLADGVNPLDAELAATWDVLKGYSGRDTDLGIARRFGDAAAAYSLRDIGAMNGRVVKARRDVDGQGSDPEEDFSANQVSSGALEDWVNGKLESTLPADVATAAAAYSLRKVKASYSGNAVQVRRTSDSVEVNVAFDSNSKVSSSSSISTVSGSTSATDLNGFLNESTENFTAIAYADIAAIFKQFSSTPTISDTAIAGSTGTVDANGARLGFKLPSQLSISDYSGLKIKVTGTINSFTADSSLIIGGAKVANGGSSFTPPEGSKTIASGTTGDFEYIFTGDTTNTFQSVVFIFSDNSTFDISNLKFEIIEHGATVDTWYDQAGSNNAVQETAANQPKIAENGALLADGIDFDGSNDELRTSTDIASSQPVTVISVTKPDAVNKRIFESITNSVRAFYGGGSNTGMNAGNTLLGTTNEVSTNTEYLQTHLFNTTNSKVFLNNVETISDDAGSNAFAGNFSLGGSSAVFDGTMKEVIVYLSDQSDNRFKIESNINNYYGLYTFQGDGFVETLYDQSGNGNDVSQTTAGSQPKIVDSGSLVKVDGIPSIKFDGTDDFLERATYTQGDLSQPSTAFAVAKLRVFVDDNQKIFDGHTSTKRNMIQLNQSGSGQFAAFAGTVQTTGEDADADQHLFESRFNGADSRFIIDGVIKSTNNQGSQDMQGINIGANHDSASNFWDGDIQEIIIYNSDLFDDRADLENDINNYYTIY